MSKLPVSQLPVERESLTPRFDAHIHIWERRWQSFAIGTARSGRFDQLNLMMVLMDRHNVAKACVIGACDQLNAQNNEFVAELCRTNSDRFVMLSEIALSASNREDLLAKTLEDWPALGFRSLVSPHENPAEWASESYAGFWERANEVGLVVSLNLSTRQAARLAPLVQRYGEINWLLDHMGRPRFDMSVDEFGGVLNLARLPNVFVKISGFYAFTRCSSEYPYADLAPYVRALRDAFGKERLLWGSDAPPVLEFSSYEQSFRCLFREEMGLSDEDLTWVLGKSAEALFLSRKTRATPLAIA